MHECRLCISLYTYVGVHACMCVRLANDLSMSKRKQNSLFVVRKYLLFTGKLDLYSDDKFYRGSCLICLIRSYGTAAPVITKSVLQLEQNNYVRPLEFGGAKSFFFRDLGGLAPPSPYVEPPLLLHHTSANITDCNCNPTLSII